MLHYGDIAALVFAAGLMLALRLLSKSKMNIRPLPPGPRPNFIVGNMFDVPLASEWITYTEYGKRFGDITFLTIFSTPIIVLNSARVASDLLEKRGTIYSGRPALPMAGDLSGFASWAVGIMQNTPKLKAHRKIIEQNFRSIISPKYQLRQLRGNALMLQELLRRPKDFSSIINLSIGSLIMEIVYAYQARPVDDEWVNLADRVLTDFGEASQPGKWLVDVIPILKYIPEWLPGASFKKQARLYRERASYLLQSQFNRVKNATLSSTGRPCIVADLLEENSFEENVIMNAAANVHAAGLDTTVSSIRSFILQMTIRQDIQKKAQDELDTICPERLATLADRPNLPYVESVMLEVFRYHHVVPLGVPHRNDVEDEYGEWRIPKHSIVIPNIWGMLHDEKMYPNPHMFDPERFMKDGKLASDVYDPRNLAFGFGRRQCPGRGLGDSQVFLAIANMLKTVEIFPPSSKRDFNLGEVKYKSGLISSPEPFDCEIIPRKGIDVEGMIKEALE